VVTYKVKLQGDDGGDYVITFEGLADKLGVVGPWNPVTETLRKDLNELANLFVDAILVPKAKDDVIAFLREHPKVETRILNRQGYMLEDLKWRAWLKAKDVLERDGVIVSVKQGRGKNRVWLLKEK